MATPESVPAAVGISTMSDTQLRERFHALILDARTFSHLVLEYMDPERVAKISSDLAELSSLAEAMREVGERLKRDDMGVRDRIFFTHGIAHGAEIFEDLKLFFDLLKKPTAGDPNG